MSAVINPSADYIAATGRAHERKPESPSDPVADFNTLRAEYWRLLFEQAKHNTGNDVTPFWTKAKTIGRSDDAKEDARAAAELWFYFQNCPKNAGVPFPIPATDVSDERLRAMTTADKDAHHAIKLAYAELQSYEERVKVFARNSVPIERDVRTTEVTRLRAALTQAKQAYNVTNTELGRAQAVRRVRPFLGYVELMGLMGLSVETPSAPKAKRKH